jgi:hypothetical protein
MSAIEVAWWLAAVGGLGSLVVVCWLKGKSVAAGAAVLGSIVPPVSAGLVLSRSGDPNAAPYVLVALGGFGLLAFGITAALRLAKPWSHWARRRYRDDKLMKAQHRFGGTHTTHPA